MTLLEGLEQELRRVCPDLELRKNEPMSKHTSFRVGGPAALMALPKTAGELADIIRLCREQWVRPFCFGNGSNLLVSDKGYDGFLISTVRMDKLLRYGNKIHAGAGVPLPKLANFAAQEGLSGLEWAQGIPGTVGGAVYMNAGAYGGEMSQVLSYINYCDSEGDPGCFRVMEEKLFWGLLIPGKPEICQDESGFMFSLPPVDDIEYIEVSGGAFSYRHSGFCDGKRFVTEASLELSPGDPAAIKAKMAELAAQRKAKQPLEYPSAGSTFKRPAPVNGEPRYAAALIDQCGLKGLTVGGAQVSEKHAGFIINKGGATCSDILELIGRVKDRVLAETGVELEPEVKFLGV